MNFNETDSLAVVERLFDEFFNPYTNNVRKQEIEMQLSGIQSSPHLGKLCLYFISNTSSHYVTMFALQNLESVINQQWPKTDWTLQEEIKSVLQTNLIFKSHGVPHFLRNKYAKLLVDVAKTDWPHKYPGFFYSILELLRSESSNQIIGLVLTKTVFEEFTGVNTTFESLERKKEVARLLGGYIPALFDILTDILDTACIKSKRSTTTTPPPSPTNQTRQVHLPLANQISQADFHSDARLLAQETLNTVQLLFSWVSIEKVPGKLIKAIFRFMDCSMNSQDEDECVSAISTINELFYKNCSPRGTESYFREIYNHIVELLRSITSSTGCIDSLNEMFVKKLSELLVLLLEQHLWRLEEDPAFTLLEFLSIFFQFSMHLSSPVCFLSCLSVWSVFFKQIKPTNAQKYSEVSIGLGSALIKKIQFSYNYSQLVDLNTVEVDENNKTELQYFINSSVDIVSQAANFAPFETFSQTLNAWNIYDKEVERCSEIWNDHHTSSNAETEKLAYILRDFSTLTFTLASLAHHFYSNENEEIYNSTTPLIFNLMENTLKSASNYKKTKSYVLRCNNQKLIQGFIDLQSELLNSLKTWLNWMEYSNQQCGSLDVFLKLILPILIDADKTPVQISMSAAQLLLELARRPTNLCPFTNLNVSEFIREAPSLKFTSVDVTNTVNSAVCDILLKHLKSFDQETLQRYKLLIGLFFTDLTRDFRDLVPNTVENNKVYITVRAVLPTLSHVIEYCRGFSVIAKKELTLAIKPTLDHALLLFPAYVKYAETHNVFSQFFMSVLKNLQSQIGAEFTKNAMQIFLQVAVGEQHSHSLEGMHHLLEIFCTVISEKHNKSFLPEILQLCMENIYPVLLPKAGENPDVFSVFLQLLYSILDCHWWYFYNTQVRLGYSPGGSDIEVGPDLPKKPDQLLALLRVFGEALLLDDLNIFRQSLLILQELNKNKKLYHKGLFRSHLLSELLRVLLNTLLYKRQGISNEDIIIAVYNMAEVDFNGFFSTFLPQYIQSLDGVTPREYELLAMHFGGTDLDVPSFMQHLQNFAVDFQHLRKCNS